MTAPAVQHFMGSIKKRKHETFKFKAAHRRIVQKVKKGHNRNSSSLLFRRRNLLEISAQCTQFSSWLKKNRTKAAKVKKSFSGSGSPRDTSGGGEGKERHRKERGGGGREVNAPHPRLSRPNNSYQSVRRYGHCHVNDHFSGLHSNGERIWREVVPGRERERQEQNSCKENNTA